jgi:hypothetical protein
MFGSVAYHVKLRKLQRGRSLADAKSRADMDSAMKDKTWREKRDEILHNRQWALEEWDDEIDQLTTDYLVSEARRLIVPLPDFKDEKFWVVSKMFGQRHLTYEGVAKVRADLRTEKRAVWDFWQTRIMLMLALIGGIFGVLAYFTK